MKKIRKIIATIICFVLAATVLAGCGGNGSPNTAGSPPPSVPPSSPPPPSAQSPAPAPSVLDTPEEPTTRTVTDMAGRTVTLPLEINTIGTFGSIGVLNALVGTMGAGHKIVNEGSASFVNASNWELYQYRFTPQIRGMREFENADREIIMENVLAAFPDLCLTMSSTYTELLEAQGLNVIQLEWAEDEDVEVCINLLGEILNAEDVAAEYLQYFEDMVERADALTSGILETERKTVVYGNITSTSQPHVIAEWWISKAGGISVTTEAFAASPGAGSLSYDLEDLLLWNPDVMFVSSARERQDVLADERLSDIGAVQNGEIYVVPRVAHVWGNRTPEQPLTIMWAMNKLYPEIMATEDLADDIFFFYSHFFKTDFTPEELAEITGG